MSWLDKSCLQLVVKRKDKPETLTFQVSDFIADSRNTRTELIAGQRILNMLINISHNSWLLFSQSRNNTFAILAT